MVRAQEPAPQHLDLPVAYSYQRISSGAQLSGGGLDRQQADAEAWCKQHGFRLDDAIRLTDAGRSAFKGAHLKKGYLGQLIAMAQAGKLGHEWTLLIEAVDRLSRLEPLDALSDVFLELARSGCRIIDLEDGQEYSSATLNRDALAMVKLALKIQAANEYSKRLSRRLSAHWDQTLDGFRDGTKAFRGGKESKGGRAPFWLQVNADRTGWEFNERADTVRLMLKLLRKDGLAIVAQKLNEQGHTTKQGKPWSGSSVRRVANDPAICGTLRIGLRKQLDAREALHRWREAKRKADDYGQQFNEPEPPAPPEVELIEGFYPALISVEEFHALQGKLEERRHSAAARANRRGGVGHTCLQGLVFCLQGNAMGITRSAPQRSAPRHYFRCRKRLDGKRCSCEGVGWERGDLEAHVMTRLSSHLLGQAAIPGVDASAELDRAVEQHQAAKAAASETAAAVVKAQEKFEWAMDHGTPDFAENASAVLEKRRAAYRAAEARVHTATAELDRVRSRVNPAAALGDDAGMNLLRAISRGEETQVDRERINSVLVSAGLAITLDATDPDHRLVGMRFGDGAEWDWKPLHAKARHLALEHGVVDATTAENSDMIAAVNWADDQPAVIEYAEGRDPAELIPPGEDPSW